MRFTAFLAVLLLACLAFAPPAGAATQDFAKWLHDLKAEASSLGISQRTIDRALPDKLKPIPHIIELDQQQPEGKNDFDGYLGRIVTGGRIEKGRAEMGIHRTTLAKVEDAYKVDRSVIVALWGIETTYGENTGGYDTVTALVTLAYDGRRSAYFRDELFKALKILDNGDVKLPDMKGSWAGAMGQSQFMPTTYLKYAEDFDKDGKRDIWNSDADVFASTANYLAACGWKIGKPWGRRVTLPADFNRNLLGVANSYTLQFWHDKGVRIPGNRAVPFEGEIEGSVIQPGGPGTSAFIVYDNFRAIMKWNKSSYFATSVGMLADRLKG